LSQPNRAVIFANGVLNDPAAARAAIQNGDIIIAADGGGRLCRQLGITPHIIIGDFDSLALADLQYFKAAGSQILSFPERKDYTDLELALRHAQSLGCSQVVVLAALGARWDQTLANLLLPAASGLADVHIRLLDSAQEVMLVRNGRETHVAGNPGDTVSLIPLGGDALGVRTFGLEYPLHGETLYFGATRGISNVLLEETASVYLEEGILLCVVIHSPGEVPSLPKPEPER
jgi:thiamine pyrophosphokinase